MSLIKFIGLTIAANLFLGLAYGQAPIPVKHYVDYNEKETSAGKASYWFIVYKKQPADTLWLREMYFNINNPPLASIGYCRDSLGLIKHGDFIHYSATNKKTRVAQYKEGKKTGIWNFWTEAGQLSGQYSYMNDILAGKTISWYKNGQVCDSFPLDNEGAGKGWGYYEDGRIRYEGMFKKGVKEGEWNYYYDTPTTQKSMVIFFVNDQIKKSTCFKENGAAQEENCVYEKEAEFPGGNSEWINYLTKSLQKVKVEKYITTPGKYQVYIKFMIDKNGTVSDVEIENPKNEELDKKAYMIIKKSPEWIPAVQYNQKVNAYRRQPITFITDY
ncbi:MAG: energy transducer TonB [Chitinophagaceae bacterium]|nr:energy transducer TonB [Chitinophagaceae bacterium]